MILMPLNDDVVKVNDMVLDVFPGEVMEYFSFDAIHPGEVDNKSLYPTEFPNRNDDDATMPLHNLQLKIGCIVILLQNLNTMQGLCNETRLRVDLLRQYSKPQSSAKEFPVQLAFAMTIKKSQGQALNMVGLYLLNPLFTHGQLYVALSRTRISSTGIVLCDGGAN
ncbi:uncharacterized protein LOC144703403 [Wolffia australiana]